MSRMERRRCSNSTSGSTLGTVHSRPSSTLPPVKRSQPKSSGPRCSRHFNTAGARDDLPLPDGAMKPAIPHMMSSGSGSALGQASRGLGSPRMGSLEPEDDANENHVVKHAKSRVEDCKNPDHLKRSNPSPLSNEKNCKERCQAQHIPDQLHFLATQHHHDATHGCNHEFRQIPGRDQGSDGT